MDIKQENKLRQFELDGIGSLKSLFYEDENMSHRATDNSLLNEIHDAQKTLIENMTTSNAQDIRSVMRVIDKARYYIRNNLLRSENERLDR